MYFKIGKYEDIIVCDVVPMSICHLLLGRPWQFDRHIYHDGHTNCYKFKWSSTDVILYPLTPIEIVNVNKKKVKVKIESTPNRVILPSVSESHKPQLSGKKKSEGDKCLVMLATKSEMRAFCENPNLVHFVLLYKDALFSPDDLTSLLSGVSHVL